MSNSKKLDSSIFELFFSSRVIHFFKNHSLFIIFRVEPPRTSKFIDAQQKNLLITFSEYGPCLQEAVFKYRKYKCQNPFCRNTNVESPKMSKVEMSKHPKCRKSICRITQNVESFFMYSDVRAMCQQFWMLGTTFWMYVSFWSTNFRRHPLFHSAGVQGVTRSLSTMVDIDRVPLSYTNLA